MIQLRGQPRPAEGEVVGPQAADSVLGQLREEQRGEGAEGEVPKVAIELHQEPWDAAVTGINVIVSKRKESLQLTHLIGFLLGFLTAVARIISTMKMRVMASRPQRVTPSHITMVTYCSLYGCFRAWSSQKNPLKIMMTDHKINACI